MSSQVFQLISLAARYWFIALALLAVLRGIYALLRERSARSALLRQLPDAGKVGELRSVELQTACPLPREGVLGSGRGCDVRIRGCKRRQLSFAFVEGRGLLFTSLYARGSVLLNDMPLGRGRYALHGDQLEINGQKYIVRLFAGLNIPRHVRYQDEVPPIGEDEWFPDSAAAGYTASPERDGGEEEAPYDAYPDEDMPEYRDEAPFATLPGSGVPSPVAFADTAGSSDGLYRYQPSEAQEAPPGETMFTRQVPPQAMPWPSEEDTGYAAPQPRRQRFFPGEEGDYSAFPDLPGSALPPQEDTNSSPQPRQPRRSSRYEGGYR